MEAGWVKDSFEKNDLKIDRCYQVLMDEVYEKHIKEDDCREIQLDLYSKSLNKNDCLYRMIVALGDVSKKTVQLTDGYTKAEGLKFSFDSLSFAQMEPLSISQELIKEQFKITNEKVEAYKYVFNPPIQERFGLVKINHDGTVKSHLCKMEDDNKLSELFCYDL